MTNLYAGIATLEQSLDYHLDRQMMLNSNIANVDTPGYKPVDLGLLPAPLPGSLLVAQTDSAHIDPQGRAAMLVPFTDPSSTPGNDQNSVDMDRELAKVAANTIRYDTASDLTSRRLAMLKYAAGDGAGA